MISLVTPKNCKIKISAGTARGCFLTGCGEILRACLHGGGGPQVGEVTGGRSPHLSCKRDQIKMSDYMDKRVTPPKRVTSPTCAPKQEASLDRTELE